MFPSHPWDEVASSQAHALPLLERILAALEKHHHPELLLEQILLATAQLPSWLLEISGLPKSNHGSAQTIFRKV